MMRTGAQRLARVLRGLVIAVFLCNLIALFLVPGLVFSEGDLTVTGYSVLQGLAGLGCQGDALPGILPVGAAHREEDAAVFVKLRDGAGVDIR